MRQRIRILGLAAAAAALSACGAAQAADAPSSAPRTSAPTTTEVQNASSPSSSARMICDTEVRHDLATLLDLPKPPRGSATWTDHVYTCTYHLAQGPLVVSVHEAAEVPAARASFRSLRQQLGTTRPLRGAAGLGLPAFETADGSVAFRKDDKTLQVDATQLPPRIQRSQRARTDLAYTLATDILGCWSGD